jgi:hypothetical protein
MAASSGPKIDASPARGALRTLSPWLGLALLWLLYELPSSLAPGSWEPWSMRPTLDVLLLLTLWGVSHVLPRFGRPLRLVLAVCAGGLVLFRLDEMIFRQLMRDEPLLYDQWFMVKHLLVLLNDLMSVGTALGVLAFFGVLGGSVWLARRLLRRAEVLLAPERRRRTALVALSLWGVMLGALAASSAEQPFVRVAAASLAGNVRDSLATYESVQRGVASSPYASYERIELARKPDVLLFLVESYGRLLSTDEGTRDTHALLLDKLEDELSATGWHSVSAYSRASVSGGRSWLSEGTILMGTPIKYEAVFDHLVSHRVPNLVGFLRDNGYETVMLAPADRERPGGGKVNRYGFDRVIGFEDIGYKGPSMGWGIIPDQYSLDFARRTLLEKKPGARPLFLDFHMVTSHAPWSAVPPLVDQPHLLDRLKSNFGPRPVDATPEAALRKHASHFERDDGKHLYMSHFTEKMRRGYQATIRYDLQAITQYLKQRPDDALVILLGDHQPPVITRANASFDCPIHVLARDPAMLAELERAGFSRGLWLPEDAPTPLSHAGLFSLLARVLAAYSGVPEQALPPVVPEGQQLLGPVGPAEVRQLAARGR